MGKRTIFVSLSSLCIVLTVYLFSSNEVEAKGQICPLMLKKLLGSSDKCEKVTCHSNLKADDCPADTKFLENIDSCGCCPGCTRVIQIDENAECGKEAATYEECGEKICPVELKECKSGLYCNPESNTCLPLENGDPQTEIGCEMKLAMYHAGLLHWQPRCNPDGTYATRQCKGLKGKIDSACFCTTEKNERIFGRRIWNDETEETMDCACSLHAHKLRSQGLLTTLHCTYDGSYEKLQCDGDSGLCYCVDPKTGEMNGAVLPEFQWKDLPCYAKEMGEKYLRQCDSHWLATERVKREASMHGLNLEKFKVVNCDYDGSFFRFEKDGNIERCVHKDGVQILSYYRQGAVGAVDMTCNCARLYIDYETEGLTIPPNAPPCHSWGNFETIWEVGSNGVCVDKDGYIYYSVPKDYACCLVNNQGATECDPSLQPKCYNSTTKQGYKQCTEIIT